MPGAQNLGEIDDALYFRNKLFTALNFPKNYFNVEDPNATRITLSAQDARFARMVERIQSAIEDGIMEICERHLEMRGFPSESFEDLKIDMTPPSAWKELSQAEIINNRISTATSIKSSLLMSDYDILTKYLKYSSEDAQRMISRNKIQKLEELKIQIIGQNPQLLGVGTPGNESSGLEVGTDETGPNPMIGLEPTENTPEQPENTEDFQPNQQELEDNETDNVVFSSPNKEELKKYNLEIEDYNKYLDDEDIDWSEEN